MLLVLVVLFTSAGVGKTAPAENDRNLEEILRRQLMNNNYDYMEHSGDSDQLTTQPPLARNQVPMMRAENSDLDDNDDLNTDDMHRGDLAHDDDRDVDHSREEFLHRLQQQADSYMPSRRKEETSVTEASVDVSHRDLHYYMDDNHFSNNHLMEKFDTETLATTARYKLLEVHEKPGLSGRRAGKAPSPRRFIQEERPDQIAILSLDDGPLPEFRLPRNRRQYMGDYGSDMEPHIPDLLMEPTSPSPADARRYRAPLPTNPAVAEDTIGNPDRSFVDDLVYLSQ